MSRCQNNFLNFFKKHPHPILLCLLLLKPPAKTKICENCAEGISAKTFFLKDAIRNAKENALEKLGKQIEIKLKSFFEENKNTLKSFNLEYSDVMLLGAYVKKGPWQDKDGNTHIIMCWDEKLALNLLQKLNSQKINCIGIDTFALKSLIDSIKNYYVEKLKDKIKSGKLPAWVKKPPKGYAVGYCPRTFERTDAIKNAIEQGAYELASMMGVKVQSLFITASVGHNSYWDREVVTFVDFKSYLSALLGINVVDGYFDKNGKIEKDATYLLCYFDEEKFRENFKKIRIENRLKTGDIILTDKDTAIALLNSEINVITKKDTIGIFPIYDAISKKGISFYRPDTSKSFLEKSDSIKIFLEKFKGDTISMEKLIKTFLKKFGKDTIIKNLPKIY